jgi:glucokinase
MPFDDLNAYAIVADIGGTFARLSRVNLENFFMDKTEIYPCADFNSFELLLLSYQKQHQLENIRDISVAIACPVMDDMISMTNTDWRFSISEVKEKLALKKFKVLNDFDAIAMSLPVLSKQQIIQVGSGSADNQGAKVVLGAGTGLGVAFLSTNQNAYTSHAGEAGHMSWGAKTEQEWFIHCYLKDKYEHVSYERLLSGQGIENLYQAIGALHKKEVKAKLAADIIPLAITQQCAIAEAAVAQFFAILGAYAGNLALTFSAFGGVYIAGGIVPRLLSVLNHSDFRARFEEKGRFKDFNARIPTYVITAEQPGLLGAAVYLKQS